MLIKTVGCGVQGEMMAVARNISAAWRYFNQLQVAGVADVYHYNVMLVHANTSDGIRCAATF